MFLTSLKQICNEYLIKFSENPSAPKLENRENISMFSTCSELTPRAPIPDGSMEQIMQPWPDLRALVMGHPSRPLHCGESSTGLRVQLPVSRPTPPGVTCSASTKKYFWEMAAEVKEIDMESEIMRRSKQVILEFRQIGQF